jgi:hypothetical protein
MLKDSQHIGHSRPSSLLVHEDASSSEQAALGEAQFGGHLFASPDVQAFDAKPHISESYLKDPDLTCIKNSLRGRPERQSTSCMRTMAIKKERTKYQNKTNV